MVAGCAADFPVAYQDVVVCGADGADVHLPKHKQQVADKLVERQVDIVAACDE